MAKPEVTCSADVVVLYDASSRLIQLGATATNTPTSWEWTILDVPEGSTADTGAKGDFTDGVATIQNPQLEIDGAIDGSYILQCIATNGDGSSNIYKDLGNGQQWIVVRSERYQQYYPGDYGYNYGKRYLDKTLRKLEEPHATTHQTGGDDVINVVGLSGVLADPQTPSAHASDHQDGGADEIDVTALSGELADPQTPKTHATTHRSGQTDPLHVGGLSGVLADPQTPASHASDHEDGGGDEIDVTALSGELADPQIPKAHAVEHKSGGTDEVKLDEFGAPTDNTNLDASASAHGLLPKLENTGGKYLKDDGTWDNPSPLTTKGDISTYDTGDQRLGVGTDGQVLKANSAQATGLEWGDPAAASPLTTKGDLYTYDTDNQRLGVGTDGQVLKANSAEATGLEWADAVGASSLDEAYDGGDNITVDGNPVTLNRTQSADDRESLEINHDFNSEQGAAILISGSNTGDGTPASEEIGAINSSLTKKVPETLYYYTMTDDELRKKIGGGAWSLVSMPDSPDDMHNIDATDVDNIWVVGEVSGNGYIAVDEGSGFARVNSHPTFGTHPYDGQSVYGDSNKISVFSKTDIWTLIRVSTNDYRFYRWDGVDWSLKYSSSGSRTRMYKAGTCYAMISGDEIIYSYDDGDSWSTESPSMFSTFMEMGTNPSTGRFRVAIIKNFGSGYETLRVYEGLPEGVGGDVWTLVGEYDHSSIGTISYNITEKHIYVGENGEVFVVINFSGGPSYMIYDFDNTPTAVSIFPYSNGMSGTSAINVVFTCNYGSSGNGFSKWDGVSVSTEDIGVNSNHSTLALASSLGESLFYCYQGSFGGSAQGSKSVVLKGKTGATHIVHADSGVMTLTKQDDPVTESNKGSIYVKDASGIVEFFYKDDQGNVIQFTSSGKLKIPVPHAEEFQTAGTETPGDIVSFALGATPSGGGTADTPTGYDLNVYIDGIKMKYKSPAPTDVNEYFYDDVNNEIDIYATGDINDFEVNYRG